MNQMDFPTDNPAHWHDEAAQRDAIQALDAYDLRELERVFHEARGLSLQNILRDLIKRRL